MSLLGDQINITSEDPFTGINAINVMGVTVDAGVEATGDYFFGLIQATVDIDGESFLISTSNNNGAPTQVQITFNLSDLDFSTGPITNVTASGGGGIVSGFTADSITVNVSVPIGNQTFTFDIECFLTGTHILTDKGEIPVEQLTIGDKVKTVEGKLETIKWVGKQTVEPSQVRNPLRTLPILIKAGALGNNLPHRDLYVSPDHAMFFEGLLINAGALVNDISIIKTERTETFVFYHVELENHALLLAEGASAESYLPQKENREGYDNGAEYEELYPHGSNLMLWPMDYPRVSSYNKVPRYIKKQLLAIAQELEGKVLLSA